VRGVRKTEHHHAERVSHEQDIHAALVEQPRGGVIVGGERGDRAFAFAAAQGFGFLKGGHGGWCRMGLRPETEKPPLGAEAGETMATRKGVEPFLPG
jgi:hypothetical protein